jgi:probable phosphoglycerate mutase
MTTPTTLWLIRHGETDWNAVRRFQGHLDVPLNERGRAQARLLAARLGLEHRTWRFAALCTSDLARAQDTAIEASATTGVPLSTRPGLRERHYGILSGLTPAEIEAKYPEIHAQWRSRSPSYVVPGGESLMQFRARVLQELADIALKFPGQAVLVVTHGGVLDLAYRAARGLTLEATRDHALHNASINLVRVAASGTLELVSWGDIGHLEGPADAAGPLGSGDWRETPV